MLGTAVELATKELEKLATREKLVLKAIAEGANTWSSVRRYIEEKQGTTIPKSTLTRLIKRLEKLSLIQDYKFLDPVYQQAAKNYEYTPPSTPNPYNTILSHYLSAPPTLCSGVFQFQLQLHENTLSAELKAAVGTRPAPNKRS
ncbi:hypothetical protein [Pyrodictium abyssi]|uniref:hypothetical protein n=1 Tax=Pyrodictium abyssi TaxID=54256 RepID=UPI003B98035D